ncbi:hypothetical protein EV702DRAFT_445675 [Suillus placidus]|uniref:Secreted protein n=1 Tax=Suillus placidus TaxID=48579 RepID=A0A9P6ZRS1_9AGAM|nr:hypothetical protein EV702DRAFT_445675 [Suillus placidus]
MNNPNCRFRWRLSCRRIIVAVPLASATLPECVRGQLGTVPTCTRRQIICRSCHYRRFYVALHMPCSYQHLGAEVLRKRNSPLQIALFNQVNASYLPIGPDSRLL